MVLIYNHTVLYIAKTCMKNLVKYYMLFPLLHTPSLQSRDEDETDG